MCASWVCTSSLPGTEGHVCKWVRGSRIVWVFISASNSILSQCWSLFVCCHANLKQIKMHKTRVTIQFSHDPLHPSAPPGTPLSGASLAAPPQEEDRPRQDSWQAASQGWGVEARDIVREGRKKQHDHRLLSPWRQKLSWSWHLPVRFPYSTLSYLPPWQIEEFPLYRLWQAQGPGFQSETWDGSRTRLCRVDLVTAPNVFPRMSKKYFMKPQQSATEYECIKNTLTAILNMHSEYF